VSDPRHRRDFKERTEELDVNRDFVQRDHDQEKGPRLVLTGKRFRLKSETVGIDSKDGSRTAVRVPAEAIVEITRGPTQKADVQMIEVLWEGRTIVMLPEDVVGRAEEIPADGGAFP